MLRKYYVLLVLAFCFSLVSCSLGPQPDKQIDLMIEIDQGSTQRIQSAKAAIEKRLEKFGAKAEVLQIGNSPKFQISIQTNAEVDRVLAFLSTPGVLEFYKVVNFPKMTPFLQAIHDDLVMKDSLASKTFIDKMNAHGYYMSGALGHVAKSDSTFVIHALKHEQYSQVLGPLKNKTMFLWGVPNGANSITPIYALETENGGPSMMQPVVMDASSSYGFNGSNRVNFSMDEASAKQWEELTDWAYQNQSLIAIVIDGVVQSAPGVSSGKITGGRSEISGQFTETQAKDLAALLSAGAIPKTKILNYSVTPL